MKIYFVDTRIFPLMACFLYTQVSLLEDFTVLLLYRFIKRMNRMYFMNVYYGRSLRKKN